jgi:uncharacterized membrane protein YedE/YeeE
MRPVAALASGVLFGAGLAVSHMTDPAVVLGFLDVAGDWNPTLAFVMGGALVVTAAGYRLVLRRERPLLEPSFQLPTRRDVDARLVGGAAAFGLGWGLVGFCPGPALAALASGQPGVFGFVAALAAGSLLARRALARPGAR